MAACHAACPGAIPGDRTNFRIRFRSLTSKPPVVCGESVGASPIGSASFIADFIDLTCGAIARVLAAAIPRPAGTFEPRQGKQRVV